jgi:hypothetical protein
MKKAIVLLLVALSICLQSVAAEKVRQTFCVYGGRYQGRKRLTSNSLMAL